MDKISSPKWFPSIPNIPSFNIFKILQDRSLSISAFCGLNYLPSNIAGTPHEFNVSLSNPVN
jgi:hypothetical protein